MRPGRSEESEEKPRRSATGDSARSPKAAPKSSRTSRKTRTTTRAKATKGKARGSARVEEVSKPAANRTAKSTATPQAVRGLVSPAPMKSFIPPVGNDAAPVPFLKNVPTARGFPRAGSLGGRTGAHRRPALLTSLNVERRLAGDGTASKLAGPAAGSSDSVEFAKSVAYEDGWYRILKRQAIDAAEHDAVDAGPDAEAAPTLGWLRKLGRKP